jgi:hypothetical protein
MSPQCGSSDYEAPVSPRRGFFGWLAASPDCCSFNLMGLPSMPAVTPIHALPGDFISVKLII